MATKPHAGRDERKLQAILLGDARLPHGVLLSMSFKGAGDPRAPRAGFHYKALTVALRLVPLPSSPDQQGCSDADDRKTETQRVIAAQRQQPTAHGSA
jgi:hypothetical protein